MGDSAAHIVEAIGKAVVVFKRVGVSLKHEMFDINLSFPQQITIVAVDTNEEIGTQEIKIFQTLGNSTSLPSIFVP